MLTLCNIILTGVGAFFGTVYFYNIDIQAETVHQTYNIILFISNIQIILQNNPIIKFIREQIKKTNNIFENEIEVIKYNQILYSTTKNMLINNPPDYFDLIVYTHENQVTHKNDKIIFNNIPFIEEFDYFLCKYNFLQMSLTISFKDVEKVYKINLSGNSYNYYVINNSINAQFIGYYLWKHHNVSYDLNYNNDTSGGNDYVNYVNYKLEIIDNNVNQICLTEKDELILGENTYIVVSTDSNNDNIQEKKPEVEQILQNVSDSMIFTSNSDSDSETVLNSESFYEFPKE